MSFATWGPGAIVLVFGSMVGIIAVLLSARRLGVSADRDTQLRDLEERAEHAIAQLRDLQLQEARIDPAFFARQKADLEGRAAKALRDRDKLLALPSSIADIIESGPDRPRRAAQGQVSPTIGWFTTRPWARALAWAAGVVAVAGVLAASLAIEQHPRDGGAMTGGDAGPGPMQGSSDSEIKELLARLQKNPRDVDAMLSLTKRLLRGQQFAEADMLIARIKELDPANPTARVYGAVLLAARGGGGEANAELDAVTKEHPELPDAWFFRGMLAMQAGDNARMQESFQRFVAVAPPGPQRDRIQGMLQSRGP